MQRKKKLLFVAEAVTLAHFARPFQLSNQLSKQNFDIHFACDSRCQNFLHQSTHSLHSLHSIPSEQFTKALANGSPLYDYTTLKHYVEEDLALIEQVKPDLIIGDFRLSLSVSARLKNIPYVTISNAYWSPYAPEHYPVPCISMTRMLGITVGGWLFKRAAPIAFKLHALPMRKLRQHYGLSALPLDLRRVYTDADYTFYADLPSLFPLNDPPDNHVFIGPILWSPPIANPDWWSSLPSSRPIVYVTMGSSGSEHTLKTILNALERQEVTVIASAAGANIPIKPQSNIFIAPYLDGHAAAARADIVICNGGSLSCQQAFAHGKPVLGIASNMDQFLNMLSVSHSGSGIVLRADQLTEAAFLHAFQRITQIPVFKQATEILQMEVNQLRDQNRFATYVTSLCEKD